MKLSGARIINYKSIIDSTWFTLNDLTCLVGKNESGKTAVLEALERIASVQPSRTDFDSDEHYPRRNLSEYQEADEVSRVVETRWTLDPDEVSFINAIVGVDVLKSADITVTKDYDNKIEWVVELDYAAAVGVLLEAGALNKADADALGKPTTTTDLIRALKAIPEPSPKQTALLTECTTKLPSGSLRAEVENYLQGRLPRFVYYSNYDRLPGQVSLDEITRERSAGNADANPGNKVFVALLSMVGTTPEAIGNITESEGLIAKLEGVQNRLTQRIFKYWSQNRDLAVHFRLDQALPGDPPPFNTGKVFRTRIENKRHGVTIKLDERSAGFVWFFSFLVWFSEVTKQFGDNLIVLLDEPGLTLHAKAQADLLRFINEQLLTKYQVIYTTHSPFMIDASQLMQCRTVEDSTGPDGDTLGTKVGDEVLSTDRDTLFPLQAALGYDLTQTLFVGPHSLLVEGPSDLLYLQWFSDELRKRKRTALDPRWTITPCGGISKVSSFLSLFGGNKIDVAVLTDFGHGDKAKVRELRDSELLANGRVLTADSYVYGAAEADIEDIIGRDNYVALVNATYSLSGKNVAPKSKRSTAPVRVTVEVADHFKTLPPAVPEYDHFAPARYLVTTSLSLPDVDGALDRFECLFKDLNALL